MWLGLDKILVRQGFCARATNRVLVLLDSVAELDFVLSGLGFVARLCG